MMQKKNQTTTLYEALVAQSSSAFGCQPKPTKLRHKPTHKPVILRVFKDT